MDARTFREKHVAALSTPGLVRRRFREWLRLLGWPADEADDLVIAVSEAVANTCEHAYPPGMPGVVHIDASRIGRGDQPWRLIINVTDRGMWRDPPVDREYRRRGIPMMRATTGRLLINAGTAGTRVTMISRPVPPPSTCSFPWPKRGILRQARAGHLIQD